jgi:hypothetical protein
MNAALNLYCKVKMKLKGLDYDSKFFYFFLTISGLSATFRFHPWVPIYYLPIFLILLKEIFTNSFNKKINIKFIVERENFLLFLFLIYLFIQSFLLGFNSKTLHYLLAYTWVFSFYFLLVYLFKRVKFINAVKFISLGFILTVITLIFEFVFYNHYNIRLIGLEYFNSYSVATLAGFRRSLAFSTEPGQAAFYLLSFLPFYVYYVINSNYNTHIKSFLIVIGYIGLFTTLSVTAFVLALSQFLLFFLFKPSIFFKNIKIIFLSFCVFILCVFALVSTSQLQISKSQLQISNDVFNLYSNNHSLDNFNNLSSDLYNKASLSPTFRSVRQRYESFFLFKNFFIQSPFYGKGISYFSSMQISSPTNWFLSLLASVGIFGILPIALFILLHLKFLFSNIYNDIFFAIFISLLTSILFLFTVSTFWAAQIWICLAIIFSKGKNARNIFN